MKADHLPPQLVSPHLSDDDLDDVLIGSGSPSATAHLTACKSCANRLAAFQSTVALFSKASLAWSEAKSNTLTRDLGAHRSRAGVSVAGLGSFATALLVAVGILLATGTGHDALSRNAPAVPGERAATASSPAGNRDEEIANDNAMLNAIDFEISHTDPSPSKLYDFEMAHPTSASRSIAPEVRD